MSNSSFQKSGNHIKESEYRSFAFIVVGLLAAAIATIGDVRLLPVELYEAKSAESVKRIENIIPRKRDFPLSLEKFSLADKQTTLDQVANPIYSVSYTKDDAKVLIHYFPRGNFEYKKDSVGNGIYAAGGRGQYNLLSGDTATVYEEFKYVRH